MHHGVDLRQPLEEDAPGGEQVLAVETRALLETEQVRDPRLDEASLLLVDDVLATTACSFPSAEVASSSSAIRQRIRTMSASAQ